MSLNLIADKIIKGRVYPALARHQALPYTQAWREFEQHWPYTVPLRLQEYCNYHDVQLNLYTLDHDWPANALYPIGLGFFDFEIDYFELLPSPVFTALREKNIRILFYYHEGDNPLCIKQRLDVLCDQHKLSHDRYIFVSANTAAKNIPGFVYFTEFELWYWQRNSSWPALDIHYGPRGRDFTVLNRLHKSWRALIMADLYQNAMLDKAYWSYCEPGKFSDADCPIEIDAVSGLRAATEKFLTATPYFSDDFGNDKRNDHSTLMPEYHNNSYCNIVVESQFDFDQSDGVFLSEKTFKPIKHGQLFFIAGAAGSLQVLRDLGYRVFDEVLDNSYDQETNHTQRWIKLRNAIVKAQPQLPKLFNQCQLDLEHNQRLFQSIKTDRLNSLIKDINESR